MISYPLTWKGNLKKGSWQKGRNCSTPAVASLLEIHTGQTFILLVLIILCACVQCIFNFRACIHTYTFQYASIQQRCPMYVNMGLKTRRYNLIKLKFYAFPFYLSFQMRRNLQLVEDGEILVEVEVFR
jgi:hypothetical protein